MQCHGVPEYVIVRGRVCVENGQVRVAEGHGTFIDTPIYPPFVYDALNGVAKTEETSNGLQKLNLHDQLEIDIPPPEPITKLLAAQAAVHFSATETPLTPGARGRVEGTKNQQQSTFSISGMS